jgi:alkylhydroperoxidase family enzyme
MAATVQPLTEDHASKDLKPIYEGMKSKFGRMPNFFGMMAHSPEVLKNFLPLYQAITGAGALEARYKELAYLKTSMVNGCEY